MKKLLILAVALFVCATAVPAFAQMDSISKTFSLVTTNSDSVTYTVRGHLESVYVDNAANKTSVVTVVSGESTLFNVTSSTDANYPIMVGSFSTVGAANSNAVAVGYTKAAIAGSLTIRVAGAANTEGTNSTTVKVIYKP